MKTASRQQEADNLIQQLKVMDQVIRQCNVVNGHPSQKTLHSVVMENGVGWFGSPLPKGMRKLKDKLCFMHATGLSVQDPDRFVYCEGFAIHGSIGFAVNHAWVLDRERDWVVVDNTWKKPITGIYLGIPFSYDFVGKCVLGGNRVYGILDRYDLKYPVLSEPPETWLHKDADSITKDFAVDRSD